MSPLRCAWVASSLAGLLIGLATARAGDCPVTLADAVGKENIAALTAMMQSNADDLWRSASLGPTPDEVASTARETIPNIVRAFWLRPVQSQQLIMADAYAGADYTSSGPDVFILPGGRRAVCHMIPGVMVFLSDGSTFHYSMVSEIDHARRTITFADPWSGVSFLRKGFNQAGVAAETAPTLGGKPGLRLTFDEFATVFRGEIDMTAELAGYSPRLTFDVIARVYPEIVETEPFLLWRYSRLLSRLSSSEGLSALGELGKRPDLDTKPGLGLLADVAAVMLAIQTNFGMVANVRAQSFTVLGDVPDSPDRQVFVGRARAEVLAFLPQMARSIPAVMMVRLIEDAAWIDDLELRLALAESFAVAHPDDIDVLLAKARALLMLERDAEARAVLARTRQVWLAAVKSVIDVPPEQAVAWFEERSPHYRLTTFNLLHWQRARLSLLEAIADPASIPGRTFDWLDAQGKTYTPEGTYGIAYDFLEDALWLAWRCGDASLERTLIATGIERGMGDAAWERHMATSVLRHAQWRHGLKGLLGEDWTATRASALKLAICEQTSRGVLPRATEAAYLARQAEIAEFCLP
ncbi:MAG: hypothetical protein R3D57_00675 [Hyphomicrobiaceae bacterium]